jgi:hypothetical protein
MISPEAIGFGMELDYRYTSFSEGLIDFSNNRVDNALEMQTVREGEGLVGFGIAKNADIFIKVPKESASMLGMKIQLLGTSSKDRSEGNKLSLAYAQGAVRDVYKGDGFKINLKSDVSEISLIHGYRFSPLVMLYEGLTIGSYEFSGVIEEAPATITASQVEYRASNVLGLHIGLELGGTNFKSKVETGYQKIKWSNTEAKNIYALSYSLGVTF